MARIPEFNERRFLSDAGAMIEIEVTLVRDWRFRLGLKLMRIAAWLIGCGLKVNAAREQEP